MRLEHHLVGGYVRYISPHIIIIIIINKNTQKTYQILRVKNTRACNSLMQFY